MSFTGKEDHRVTLQEATDWTANYRSANPGAVKAHFFGKDTLLAILNQNDCVGIRMYHAIDDRGTTCMVLVGADKNENDLYNGILAERGMLCPPFCPNGSPLQ